MMKHAKTIAALLVALLFLSGCGAAAPASSFSPAPLPAIQVPSSRPPLPPPPVPTPSVFTKEIDFDALQGDNPDYIGWLVVPGILVDYGVMYCDDNSYYLNHNESREPAVSGALFADMSNERDFSDHVTVIYGHYMPDESYFTQLHRYKSREYFDENRQVLLYTPLGNMEYEIIAAFETDNRNILYQKDYSQPTVKQELLDWVAGQQGEEACVNLDDVTTDDTFLVLSTCVQLVGGDGRLLVFARRLEAGV